MAWTGDPPLSMAYADHRHTGNAIWVNTTDNTSGWSLQQLLSDCYRYSQQPAVLVPPSVQQGEPMRGLFEVFIVNPDKGVVTHKECIVADNEDKARLKMFKWAESDMDIDDLDIIVRRLGDVRPKRAKPQEVRVINDG